MISANFPKEMTEKSIFAIENNFFSNIVTIVLLIIRIFAP